MKVTIRGWNSEDVSHVKETNFGQELHRVLTSRDFQQRLAVAQPYLISSLLAWPSFWLYKGLEWSNKRGNEALHVYIRKTFYQAKMMQLALIATGILAAMFQDSRQRGLEVENVEHGRRGRDRDHDRGRERDRDRHDHHHRDHRDEY